MKEIFRNKEISLVSKGGELSLTTDIISIKNGEIWNIKKVRLRMKKLKLLWVFFLYFLASIHASAQNATGTAASIQDGNHKEENLSVLNQWITWNNPGSLLINSS
jgi:hypothetical protein